MGALVDGPEPDELADFGSHCFLAGERSDQAASSLLTGDQSALRVAAVPWGLLSLGFPRVPFFVPSGRLLGAWSGTQATETRHSRRSEACGDGSG